MANDPSELRKEKVCKQVGDGLLDGSYLSPCDWRESWKEQWRVVVGGRRWGGRGCVWVGGGVSGDWVFARRASFRLSSILE